MTPRTTRSSARISRLSKNTESPRSPKKYIFISDDSDDENPNFFQTKAAPCTPRKEKSRNTDLDVNSVTPPKQRKRENGVQHTPQHKTVEISDQVSRTPSSLLGKLSLTSPRDKSNRKSLFADKEQENNGKAIIEEKQNRKNALKEKTGQRITNLKLLDNSEKDPEDGKLARRSSVYQNARRALHSTFPSDMPGRENELDELRQFIKGHLENETSGSLYVSGPPGTGKTASLNMIFQEENLTLEFKNVYVNCTAIKSPSAIYSRILKELGIKVKVNTEKDYLTKIESHLKKSHKMILLVLDEIDQLESKNQSILYTIFEWPSKPHSKLILIGIANALDLTDRTLPRLQARCELKPKLMHFAPYTKQQIVEIFTSRLKSAGVLEVFSPVALQMLAGKVAAVSGDVRRALDIGRRVIELVDQSKKEDILKPIENLANELVDNVAVEGKPKAVDLKQVVNVLNKVYGTSQNLTEETDDSFPLQQKITVCSLILMLKKAKNKDVTIGKLHEVYKRVCEKRNILAVDQAEFVGLCSLIETRGMLRVSGKKEPRLHKVSLEWDEEEVAGALKDKQLMSMILQDDSCLGKL